MSFKPYYILLTFLFVQSTWAQQVMTLENYIELIKQYHPLAKQADIITKRADAQLLSSRGSFDPKFYLDKSVKEFETKQYFDMNDMGFKIPTWYGIEVKGGYNYNTGTFLNPENNVTTNGVTYLGISLPVLQNLVIDKRRAALRKAKLFVDMSEQERNLALNELYFEALSTYALWQQAYEKFQLYASAVDVSKERYGFMTRSYLLGDKPAVDTLEALILYQNRIKTREESRIKFVKASLQLSNFLWDEQNNPLEIPEDLIPEKLNLNTINIDSCTAIINDIDNQISTHPKIVAYQLKLSQLDIDRRLKLEKLKPKFNVNYNLLTRDFGENNFLPTENYKWGLSLSIPIPNRSAIGGYRESKLKIESTEYALQQKQREIGTKLNFIHRQLQITDGLIEVSRSNAENYEALFNAEQLKLDLGETSLFKLNAREIKLLEAQAKYIQVQAEQLINYYSFYRGFGRLQY